MTGVSEQRAALARQLADAVVATEGTVPLDGPVEGRKRLRAVLDQFKLAPPARALSRRESVEGQLFAAELLLNSDLDGDPKLARKDLKYLDALLTVFQGRRDMRPYLRRYYELAVRACSRNDVVQMAHYVLASRMIERPGAPAAKSSLLLFSFTPKENFALFLPSGGQPGKRFELDITREQIKQAKGKPLHLSDELAAHVKAEMEAGRPVEVFWDDTASRPGEDPDALTDHDWPFDSQLPLAKLRAALATRRTSGGVILTRSVSEGVIQAQSASEAAIPTRIASERTPLYPESKPVTMGSAVAPWQAFRFPAGFEKFVTLLAAAI